MGSESFTTIISLAIVAGIFYVFFKALRSVFGANRGSTVHCMTCGTDAPAQKRTRGSIWIEVILWLLFIVPGLVYSLWRLSTRRDVCAACGSEAIVPVDAPAAISHRKSLAP